jgi:hypothetical protein
MPLIGRVRYAGGSKGIVREKRRDVCNRFIKAEGIFVDVGPRVATALQRDFLLDFDPVPADIWLTHYEDRYHRRSCSCSQAGQAATRRSDFAEERHENGLAAFGVLIEGNP